MEHHDSQLSSLITHLYDAAIDDTLWPGTAARIAASFGSVSTVVKLHGDAGVGLLECTDNLIVPGRDAAWADDWHRQDLWVERSVAHGMSRVITDEDLVTPVEQATSGFYQEWLSHLGIYHMVGAVFPAADGAIGVLGIHRSRESGAYTPSERRQVAVVLPHLQRALRLRHRGAATLQAHAPALQALDRIDTGVLVVDGVCIIHQASAMAERLLRDNSELGVVAGRLALAQPALQDTLLAMVRAALGIASGNAARAAAALCIPRLNRLPLALEVMPLRASSLSLEQQPAVLIFIRDPEAPIAAERVRELFGLTRTEAAVAAALGRGSAPDAIAAGMGIGLATVRSHLKSILAKTGTHRQAELVTLLARSIATMEP